MYLFQIRDLRKMTNTQFIFVIKNWAASFLKWYKDLSKYVQNTENVEMMKTTTNFAQVISRQYKKLKSTAKISQHSNDHSVEVDVSSDCKKELLP